MTTGRLFAEDVGKDAPLKPALPSTLTHWPIYCLKLGLSSGLAWRFCQLTGIQDAVSATFVAVVCTMPTLTTGFRASSEQAIGSLLGGGVAYMLMRAGLGGPAGLALAVGLSALLSYPVRLRPAHVVAAFTALLVMITGIPTPGPSFAHRLGAVLIGAGSATLLNFLASAVQYRTIFRRRRGLVRLAVAAALEAGDRGSTDRADALLRDLQGELRDVSREASHDTRIPGHLTEVEILREILAVAWVQRLEAEAVDLSPVARVIERGEAPPRPVGTLATLLTRWYEAACEPDGTVPPARDLAPSGWFTLG
jgi:hypothetical protein